MDFKRTSEVAIRKALNALMNELQTKLRDELEAQGHVLTKKLWHSIKYETKKIHNGLETYMLTEHYGLNLDRGVDPKDIPFTPGSGAGKSKYIQGLLRFFRLRGLGPKDAKRAAFATAHTQRREGMPTSGSYRFSSNQRRKGWLTGTLARNEDMIDQRIGEVADEGVQVAFRAYTKELDRVWN